MAPSTFHTAIRMGSLLDTLVTALLMGHILFGVLAFAGASGALVTKFFDAPHEWHRYTGQVFFIAMAGIFATGLSMSLISSNLAMLFISLFSFYLAFMGRRYAKNRNGDVRRMDYIVISAALVMFLSMTAYGAWLISGGSGAGIVVAVFGGIGAANAAGDMRVVLRGGIRGHARIAEHLGKMLGGTIAIVTAFVVINVRTEPVFVAWLAPAVLLTPVIAWWSARIRRGMVRKGM